MNCAEIRSGFLLGQVPDGPDVTRHVAACPHCGELFQDGAKMGRLLALAVPLPVEAGNLFEQVRQDAAREVGLRAKLRSLPTRVRAGTLVAIGLLLLASQLLWQRRTDFAAYSPGVFWGVVAALTAALAWGAWRVARGVSAPLVAGERNAAVAWLLLLLPVPLAVLSPWGSPSGPTTDATAWGSPGACFGYGAVMVVPLVMLARLFERRDRPPPSVAVSVAALSGLAANLLLHAHCASSHLGHLLFGHAAVGFAWALALAVSGRLPHARRA